MEPIQTSEAVATIDIEDELSIDELEFVANDLSADALWSLNPSTTEAKCC